MKFLFVLVSLFVILFSVVESGMMKSKLKTSTNQKCIIVGGLPPGASCRLNRECCNNTCLNLKCKW